MLHKEAVDRINDLNVPGEGWLDLFQQIVVDAIDNNQDGLDVCIGFIEKDDVFVTGTYVPEIHLIVRRVDD